MDEGKGWLRPHWKTALGLVVIFGLAMFLRIYFVAGLAFYPVPATCPGVYTPAFSGGSDSYYWDRTLCYSFQTGRDLGLDPMLSYPLPVQNPRLPLLPWFSLLVGRLLAPLFPNSWNAVMFTFLISAALFGALTIFPTYALAKEAFNRKAGLISALLLAISAGHLQRSIATDTRSASLTLFFIVSTFYFFLRALNTLQGRRWVDNWFRMGSIRTGLGAFFRENRTSVLYAILAGLCVAATALTWLGWAYVVVILLAWFGVESFLARFRNEDTMGTWILITITLGTGLALAFQWYFVRTQIPVWFDVPVYLFFASFVLGLAFTVTRDYPWTLVVPSTFIAGAVGLAVGVFVNPALSNAFFTGAGYFVQSKVVTTIAEDQAPGMSQMILSFGLFTFGVSLLAIGYLVWQIPRRREPAYSLVVIWAFAAVFMAITAARFIFNASPAFAIGAGFAIDQLLVRADFAGMRRTYRSLAEGSWRNALRKSVKARHILSVLGIVFLVLVPNVWWAVDASIPFELKAQYDHQVANLLPSFLRSPGYNPGSQNPFYFGAFGYAIPKATDYYPAAWQWFATQDANTPPELRPAFLSWWDYGFEAVDRGAHPTVADNFQHGVGLAGQFITAQNETQGIAFLVVRLLEGDFRRHRSDFSPAVPAVLQASGLPVATFRSVLLDARPYLPLVISDPVTYGLWAPDMAPVNAESLYLATLITKHLKQDGVVSLYHAVRDATGFDIGYFAVDSRLFPISASNTGIFYAPVKLSDHRVVQLPDGRVLPFEFFQILATTNRGSNIPIQFIGPGDQVQSQTIQYEPAFYQSMFYRAYIGYSPTDLGSTDKGIPGFSQALQSSPPVPAWNLTHWRVVYRTAYYNPYKDVSNHSTAWRAMNYDQARQIQSQIQVGTMTGTVDLSTQSSVANGVVFLRYYDGAWVNGTVAADSHSLPSVWVTVTDELGTPHYLTRTDAQGHYSALVPFGNVTITASAGSLTRTTLVGARTLGSITLPVTFDQAERAPIDSNGDGIPDWIMTRDLHVTAYTAQGTAFFDLNRDGSFGAGDEPAPGVTVTLTNRQFADHRIALSGPDGRYSIPGLPLGTYGVTVASNGRTVAAPDLSITATAGAQDIRVPFAAVRGFATSSTGTPVGSARIEFLDETNATVIPVTSQGDGSFLVRPLLAGNYTVTSSSGDLASAPARIRTQNADLWQNVTLRPSGTVTGLTTLYGTALPFASLQFQPATDPGMARTTTSDGNARYSIRLAAGEWFVSGRFYGSSGLSATLGRVIVGAGATTTFDAMFVAGVRVTGTVSDANPAVRNPEATVGFAGPLGQLWLRTDPQGGYLAFLPAGTYDLEAFNVAGAYFATVSLPMSRQLNIALAATSEPVVWNVYRDLNGNGVVDAGESIADAHVGLTDNRGAHIAVTTNASGEVLIPLFGNRTYAGTVTAAGYETRTISSSSPVQLRTMMPIALTPSLVVVQGSVLLGGSPVLNRAFTVSAVPLGAGAIGRRTTTDSNGGYALGLMPGTYALVVDENVSSTRDMRYQNRGTDRVLLSVGLGTLPYDINIVARTLVVGSVTLSGSAHDAALAFDGAERRFTNATTAGFSVYLIPGTYTVAGNRTISGSAYGFFGTAKVPSATNLTFALTLAADVTGRTLFGGVAVTGPMPVSFVRREGGSISVSTDASGAYVAFLVPGNYSVTLSGTNSATEVGVTRYYAYSFSGNLTVSSGQPPVSFDLTVSRTFDNTTVSGTATLAGIGIDAIATFTARGGGAITAQVSANPSGAYAISLAPGIYDVFATRASGRVAFLARVAVPHATSFAQNLPLANAFVLSGVTTDPQGLRTSTPITIQASAELDFTSDASGSYQAVLPPGVYTLSASKPATENGIAVTYHLTTSVALTSDTILNLRLEKLVSRSASLSWDASQRREIAAGDSVTYTIVTQNTGNVADTFDFAGQPFDWQFSFAPASVSLNFGNAGSTTAAVAVTVRSPSNALVDHGAIQITAKSSAGGTTVGNVQVQVDIQRVRGLSLSLDSTAAPAFDGRFLNYTVLVKNSGNAPETVNVAITNPTDVSASGWSALLGANGAPPRGTTLSGLTVGANSSMRVLLQAQSRGGVSGPAVVIQVTAQDSMAVSATGVFTLQLPALASGDVTVTGPDVTRAAPLNLPIIALIAGAVAAIGVGLVLTRRRR